MLEFHLQHLPGASALQHREDLVERNDLPGLQGPARPVVAVLVGHCGGEDHEEHEAGEDAHGQNSWRQEAAKQPTMQGRG